VNGITLPLALSAAGHAICLVLLLLYLTDTAPPMPEPIAKGGIEPVTRPWTDHAQPPFEIQWNRVYTLPDFVRFPHNPHIHAGVQCQSCHGPVETMDRIVPVYEINMDFCVDCHTERHATLDCVGCHH